MELKAIREFVNDHPEGVIIRMVNGTEYEIPHRDYVWFVPTGGNDGKANRMATSFYISHEEVGRLVNSLLVLEIVPLKQNGKSQRGGRKKSA
ncbi:MAG: hypothetical protein JNM86_02680 [Phycisphaerae bacterium]|nr:hypothetical protein [Phycisphaerae bacterium]